MVIVVTSRLTHPTVSCRHADRPRAGPTWEVLIIRPRRPLPRAPPRRYRGRGPGADRPPAGRCCPRGGAVPGRRPGVAPLRAGTPGRGAPTPPFRGAAAEDPGPGPRTGRRHATDRWPERVSGTPHRCGPVLTFRPPCTLARGGAR